MTVLMREDLNDADLAWARADAPSGRVVKSPRPGCASPPAEQSDPPGWPRKGRLLQPAPLRAGGVP